MIHAMPLTASGITAKIKNLVEQGKAVQLAECEDSITSITLSWAAREPKTKIPGALDGSIYNLSTALGPWIGQYPNLGFIGNILFFVVFSCFVHVSVCISLYNDSFQKKCQSL